ncbi:extensin family protein [Roseiarcaceae bacterium H3SJ34-1]|uniref:extensin-like domain-containing protein n=1 Tax=Terripilifer ovatus TaxID=3032367 RepID=UPI003AB99111|nr:extensin family protein [Roseiarcaceae bacterium H3SJ34-1]
MRRSFRLSAAILLAAAAVTIVVRLPPQHVPWGVADLNADVGLFSSLKLARLRSDAPACRSALRMAQVQFRTLPDDIANPQCAQENMVVLERSSYAYAPGVRANCGLAAALSVWERKVVLPAARQFLASDTESIRHLGVYACRAVRGSHLRQSQHANAAAIDIQSFRLRDGRVIDVQGNWGKDTAAGHFLRAVHDGACGVFRTVLGPDYNAAHANHLHLDIGPFSICR